MPVSADREQIAQVVQNLVINAVQSMPHGGTIAVRAALVELREGDVHQLPRGQYVRWTVQDEGVGVPQPYLSRIFDQYFTTKAKGRGLGLAVCHSIVTKHGGHIGVESQAGSGTLFTIHLPAVDASRMTPAAGSGTVHVGRGRVLVMDDDPQVARVQRRLLKRLGYSV